MLAVLLDLLSNLAETYRELELYNASPAKSVWCRKLIQSEIAGLEAELYGWLKVRPDPPLVFNGLYITADSEGAIHYRHVEHPRRNGWWGAEPSCN